MAKRVMAATLGCKVNLYDTRAVLQKFAEAGYEVVDFKDGGGPVDLCIVNTCCVTNLAERKSRQAIRRARALGADAVAVMGCASQANPAQFHEAGADFVVGTDDRLLLFDEICGGQKHTQQNLDFGFVDKTDDRTRAFLKIQEGCDNFCSYCIVPYVRGASRSRAFADVLSQAKHFEAAGYKEIVLSGIHAASYGKDFEGENCGLVDVLTAICGLEGIERVRLSSADACVVTPQFLDFVADNPKFCSHLHLSLQSGSDRILGLMNRKYTAAGFAEAIYKLRAIRPEFSITTDVIAGFPGETDAEHRQTMALLEKLGLTGLHVFPYAAKAKTAAAAMPGQIDAKVKRQRAAELAALDKRLKEAYCGHFVGQTKNVLVEELDRNGLFLGKTGNYISVCFEASAEVSSLVNEIVAVKLEAYEGGMMFGSMKY